MIDRTYIQGDFIYQTIYEPKERLLMKLDIPDRIVQNGWNTIVNQFIDRRMYPYSFASRIGKGVHAATKTLHNHLYGLVQKQARKIWALKGDIYHFFPTVDHAILKKKMRQYIEDPDMLYLTDMFIDMNGILPDGMGLPIGTLASQVFANAYGDILDWFVDDLIKKSPNLFFYIRYMDDFIILGDDYHYLEDIKWQIDIFMRERMKMCLNEKTTILYAQDGIDFIGFFHKPTHFVPRKKTIYKLNKLINIYYNNSPDDLDPFVRSFNSRVGFIQHADTYVTREFLERDFEDILILEKEAKTQDFINYITGEYRGLGLTEDNFMFDFPINYELLN